VQIPDQPDRRALKPVSCDDKAKKHREIVQMAGTGNEKLSSNARWYLRHQLSYRAQADMMAEREPDIVHTIIMHWMQRHVPEFEKR
jgi:hypothetical protein